MEKPSESGAAFFADPSPDTEEELAFVDSPPLKLSVTGLSDTGSAEASMGRSSANSASPMSSVSD